MIMDMAIASQRLVAIVYDAYQVFLYDAGTAGMKRATDDYAASKTRVHELIDNAEKLLPEESQALGSLQSQAESIIEITDKAVAAGSANRDAEAKALLVQADEKAAKTIGEMRTWINGASDGIKTRSAELSERRATPSCTPLSPSPGYFRLRFSWPCLLRSAKSRLRSSVCVHA